MNLHIRDTFNWLENPYELARWLVYIFLAGMVSILPFSALSDYYLRTMVVAVQNGPYPSVNNGVVQSGPPSLTLEQNLTVFAGFATVFLIAFLVSLGLTRMFPERKIVPPFFIHLIVLGWFFTTFQSSGAYLSGLIFPYSQVAASGLVIWYFVASLYLFVAGVVQDRLAVGLTGKTARPDSILRCSMRVTMEPEAVRSLLLSNRFRVGFSLSRKSEREADGTIYLWRRTAYAHAMTIQLRPVRESHDTLINVVEFEKRTYYIMASESLTETYYSDIAYLKSVFQRHDPPVQVADEPPTNAEELVHQTIAEQQGLASQFEKVSRMGWVKLVLLVLGFSVAGTFLYIKDYTNGLVLIASAVLYLAIELPSRIRQRNE